MRDEKEIAKTAQERAIEREERRGETEIRN